MLANATSLSPLVHEPRGVFDGASEGMELSSFRVYLAAARRVLSHRLNDALEMVIVGLSLDYAALMPLHGDGVAVPLQDARTLRQR